MAPATKLARQMTPQVEARMEFAQAGEVRVTHVAWRLTWRQEGFPVWNMCQASEVFGQMEKPFYSLLQHVEFWRKEI